MSPSNLVGNLQQTVEFCISFDIPPNSSPKNVFCHRLFSLMSFKTFTLFLWNTKEDIQRNICVVLCLINGSQWDPMLFGYQRSWTYLHCRRKIIQVWHDIRASKSLAEMLHVNCPLVAITAGHIQTLFWYLVRDFKLVQTAWSLPGWPKTVFLKISTKSTKATKSCTRNIIALLKTKTECLMQWSPYT